MSRYEEWTPFSWHCPNCGKIVSGYRGTDGRIKVQCINCRVVMSRKIMGRRHDTIDLYAPEGQEHVV